MSTLSRTSRLAIGATAVAVVGAGLVVSASSTQRPADELEYVVARAGDDWNAIVDNGSMSCSASDLRAANGGIPIEAGRIVLIPPSCLGGSPSTPSAPDTTGAPVDEATKGTTAPQPPASVPAAPADTAPADTAPADTAPPARSPGTLDYDPSAFLSTGNPIPKYKSNGQFSEGAMRMVCRGGHLSYDDPIVAPGVPNATHLHQFFGNLDIDANTTADNIRDSGDTTCQGGPLNRSGYWVPALIDHGTDQIVPIQEVVVYYKGEPDHDAGPVQPLPDGLRMITDDSSWSCGGDSIAAGCSSLTATVSFKWCWNGQLDAADHRSHLASASYVNGVHTCPPTHPTVIPRITYNIAYDTAGLSNSSNWRLSSDDDHMMVKMMGMHHAENGQTMHGDWFNGWNVIDPSTGETADDVFYRECLDGLRNCDFGDLGDGRKMIFPPSAVDQKPTPAPSPLPGG